MEDKRQNLRFNAATSSAPSSAPLSAPTRRGLLGLFGFGLATLGIGAYSAPGRANHLRRRPPGPTYPGQPGPGQPPGGANLTAEEMVGKLLRVVRPGDFVTQDFSLDRVTIDVDDNGRILRVRLG